MDARIRLPAFVRSIPPQKLRPLFFYIGGVFFLFYFTVLWYFTFFTLDSIDYFEWLPFFLGGLGTGLVNVAERNRLLDGGAPFDGQYGSFNYSRSTQAGYTLIYGGTAFSILIVIFKYVVRQHFGAQMSPAFMSVMCSANVIQACYMFLMGQNLQDDFDYYNQ